ncbi:M50 family metallopeptidase [Gorillibacterium sp. CAU 1737]|uniref:M50 family metallopeptidase n=1 Tax=Gorillibacterium sp. CAU 1737 TaxID=3140362 RepID=UPI003260FA7E
MIKWGGTVYRLHPLFVLMMLLSALTGYFLELLTLFGVVLIHELGHVAAARSFGWRIREVRLLPFGGVAITDEGGNVPSREELIVALCGPLQNALLMGFALAMQGMGLGDGNWWDYFFRANLVIALFNLLPIYPLDGGKVLFVLLGQFVPYHRVLVLGTRLSLGLSALLTIGAAVPGMTGGLNLNMLAVGLFLLVTNWVGSRQILFHFYRYLMGKQASMQREGAGRYRPIRRLDVGHKSTLLETSKLFMRDYHHLICIRGSQGGLERVVPEQALLQVFFDGQKTDRAVSEVFL